jgi:hypothetical protein
MPTIEQFEMGRANSNVYRLFCEKFVVCVIGRDTFVRNCCASKFSTYCTISDETMTFLILSNNFEIWKEIGEAAKSGNQKLLVGTCSEKQKFFTEGKGRGKSWNYEGKEYYNDMYDKIESD